MAKPAQSRRGSEGNAALIGAAVAMLLMMAGLFYWKLGSREVEPEQPAQTPSAAPTDPDEQVLEEAPPPPPKLGEEDAGTEEQGVAQGKKGKKGKGGCAGPCKGKVTGTLQTALRARAGQARRCYERALRLNPTLKGRLTINVTVGAAGQVCSANIGSNTLGDPGVTNCALQAFQGATLPPPQGGCVKTAVPVNFVPKT